MDQDDEQGVPPERWIVHMPLDAQDMSVDRAPRYVEPTADERRRREILPEACRRWQSGRDGGSSLLRAAARVLTGIPHYFSSDFIDDYERRARADPEALEQAWALLWAVGDRTVLSGEGWRIHLGLSLAGSFAGRGIVSGPQDDQILQALGTGRIRMPLWGVSLDPAVAAGFGTRFRFEILDAFHGVPAWAQTGEQEEMLEIITGGEYEVADSYQEGETTVAVVREVARIEPPESPRPPDG